ncbi:MAG TPA: hypothetical protein DCK76_04485 [Desulfotomaculum sp.]|nr:hypothetical protein [Desulfotomaculum sp.]
MFFKYRSYLVIDLAGDFLDAGKTPGFPAERAVHLLIRDLVNHCDFGKVGDFASVTLMTKPGAPLPGLIRRMPTVAIVHTCLFLSLRRRLLFGGAAKDGAIAFIEQGSQTLIFSSETIYHAILLPDNLAVRIRTKGSAGQIFLWVG